MRLEEHQVTTLAVAARLKEMVEADLEQVSRTGVTGNVTTEFPVFGIGLGNHGQRVPTHQRCQLFFNRQIAREAALLVHRDAVHIGRRQFRRPSNLRRVGRAHQLVQHIARAVRPLRVDQRQKRVAPFGGFQRVGIDWKIGNR